VKAGRSHNLATVEDCGDGNGMLGGDADQASLRIMRTKGTLDTPAIQSLDRGLAILEAVAESSRPVPLKHLTDLIGIDRSSVFRLANTLRQRRFLANPDGSKDYILGPSAWRLSRRSGRSGLSTFSHEHLRLLTAKTGETSHLAVREGGQALFIDHHTPTGQVVSVSGQTGEFVPLYCTAHGKALLADLDLTQLKAIFGGRPLHAYSSRTTVALPKLAKDCAKIRLNGFAVDEGEYVEELRCVAAPVRDQHGVIVASVGISAPFTRFPKQRTLNTAAAVLAAAKEIAAALNG
jgi:DNA-binding IclR family transcriptional regulator